MVQSAAVQVVQSTDRALVPLLLRFFNENDVEEYSPCPGTSIEYSWDGGARTFLMTPPSPGQFVANVPVPPVRAGQHTITIYATDLAGNTSGEGSNAAQWQEDSSTPATPTIALNSDSGMLTATIRLARKSLRKTYRINVTRIIPTITFSRTVSVVRLIRFVRS